MTKVTPAELEKLRGLARQASYRAYAPYSNYPVGVAILAEDGRTYVGCNVENASYPLGMCAERNAIGHMIAGDSLAIKAVVVYTPTPKPASPCGGCRQVINEFGPEAEIYSFCDGPDTIIKTLSELLPDAFGPNNLRN